MVEDMSGKNFLRGDQGVVEIEYALFAAAIGILLIVGVGVLFRAMGNFFITWATYFGAGS